MKAARWTAAVLLAAGAAGCREPVRLPVEVQVLRTGQAEQRSYDADGDGRPDFFTSAPAGRIDRIACDRSGDGKPDEWISLDGVPLAECRHLVVILDGFGYDFVKAYYDAGHLRLFHPPSAVVAPYPTLTDPCLAAALGLGPCTALEARYYDRRAGKVVGGNTAYLAGRNMPYNRVLQYRAKMLWDAVSYVKPRPVFKKEVHDTKRTFDRLQRREVLAYLVSSAGVGTKYGAPGQRQCLALVDRLVHQVILESRGRVKVTLFADHGHSYTQARRIDLAGRLKRRGWHVTGRLKKPRDVAYIRFGLETYAGFATDSPAELAADLVDADGVDVVSFAADGTVVVLSAAGSRAVIRAKGGRYAYEAVVGDPLVLKPILAGLTPDAEGFHDADDLLAATAAHRYPAPLQRLWQAHFALVANPPDVIASLTDDYYSGSQAFAVKVASTHGGLNYRNSVTFIMSTAGPLPPVLRTADIPAGLKRLLGTTDWPMGDAAPATRPVPP